MKNFFLLLLFLVMNLALQAQNAHIGRGNMYYRQSQFELAEAQYRKALDVDASNTVAQFNLANALQRQKKFKEAVDVTERAAAGASDKNLRSQLFYNQGVAHTKLKNLEGSIDSYKKALRLNPNDQQARENLQKALLEQKKQQQQQQQQQQNQSSMSQNEAERKLKLLQQRERELQQRMRSRKQGQGQSQDW